MSQLQNVILKFIAALETAHKFWIFYGKSQNNYIFQDFFFQNITQYVVEIWNVDVDRISNPSFRIKQLNEKDYGFWRV